MATSFNTPMWTNFYNSAKQAASRATATQQAASPVVAGAQAGASFGASPTVPKPITAQDPTVQIGTLAQPTASVTPSPTPAPTQAAAPVTPPVPTDPNTPGFQGVQSQLLKNYANAANGQPTAGTAAQIRANNQQLATYAGGLEKQAGARVAQAGALGQGTAPQAADATKQSVLSQMASTEQANTTLVSNEALALSKQAQDAATANQANTSSVQEFNANLAQNASQFTQKLGADAAAQATTALTAMAADNPVLASKLTTYLANGGTSTGPLGAFTPQEQQDMKDYVAKNASTNDALTGAITKYLGNLGTQADQTSTDQTNANLLTSAQGKITAGDIGKLTPQETQAALQNGTIKNVTTADVRSIVGSDNNTAVKGSTIQYNGQIYKVVNALSPRTGSTQGLTGRNYTHADTAQVTDSSGKSFWILQDGSMLDHNPSQAELNAHLGA